VAACPFCDVPAARMVWSDELVVAIRDLYPVSPGHTLFVPRRHVATWFDASEAEQRSIWRAVAAIKEPARRGARGRRTATTSGSTSGRRRGRR
jgi:diadenosine tetraphosphate (Ap4A) HIT family hydrolase